MQLILLVSLLLPQASTPLSAGNRWGKQEWLPNDSDLKAVRNQIDSIATNSHRLENARRLVPLRDAFRTNYRKRFRKEDLFGWAYASYQTYRMSAKLGWGQDMQDSLKALVNLPKIDSYELARVRWLLTERLVHDLSETYIGERLLQRDPKDLLVKYALVNYYDPTSTPAKRDRALQLVDELVRDYPTLPSVRARCGDTYFVSTWRYHDWNRLRRAQQEMSKFLAIAPPDDPYRPMAKKILGQIGRKLETKDWNRW